MALGILYLGLFFIFNFFIFFFCVKLVRYTFLYYYCKTKQYKNVKIMISKQLNEAIEKAKFLNTVDTRRRLESNYFIFNLGGLKFVGYDLTDPKPDLIPGAQSWTINDRYTIQKIQ